MVSMNDNGFMPSLSVTILEITFLKVWHETEVLSTYWSESENIYPTIKITENRLVTYFIATMIQLPKKNYVGVKTVGSLYIHCNQ